MRSGKELILATKIFATENRIHSWYYLLSTLLFLILALGLTLWNFNLFFRIISSIITGLLLVRMFVIYHDHQHNAILNRSKIASLIMKAFGLYILAPTGIWKRSHDFHHKHNSKLHVTDIGAFPTITKAQYMQCSDNERNRYLALRHPVNIALGYVTVFMFFVLYQFSCKEHP